MSTKCFGYDYRTGHAIRVEFGAAIEAVDELVGAVEGIETWLAPGFIDLQVNGFAGVDYCSPHSSMEEMGRSIRAQFACGVSRIYPTVITGSAEDMQGAFRNIVKAKRELPEGEAFEAIHAEGPFISAEDGPRGAHPVKQARRPSLEEWRRMQDAAEGNIRLLTVSPEYEGSAEFIAEGAPDGILGDQTAVFSYVKSASLAFWDATLKKDEAARAYLKGDELSKASQGAVELSRK